MGPKTAGPPARADQPPALAQPGWAWGHSRPHPAHLRQELRETDGIQGASRRTNRLTHPPAAPREAGPRDNASSPSPVPGQGLGPPHRRWQWSPTSFLLPSPSQPLFRWPGQSRTPLYGLPRPPRSPWPGTLSSPGTRPPDPTRRLGAGRLDAESAGQAC